MLSLIFAVASTFAFAAPAPVQDVGGSLGAKSAATKIGTRETRDQEGIDPLERLDTRIQNRVQSRIRNRVDRYYDPEANAVSPFAVAGERIRRSGLHPR